jgi:hypothetical protein
MDTGSEEMLLLIKTFEAFQVKYLIVGGFAVNRYGFNRTTGDFDIYLKDSELNRRQLIKALAAMGYGEFEMLMNVPIIAGYCEIIMDDGMYADLMTDIPGLEQLNFDEYFDMATVDNLDGYVVRYLHYNHLIRNKEATGRTKDLLDLEELKRINKDL